MSPDVWPADDAGVAGVGVALTAAVLVLVFVSVVVLQATPESIASAANKIKYVEKSLFIYRLLIFRLKIVLRAI